MGLGASITLFSWFLEAEMSDRLSRDTVRSVARIQTALDITLSGVLARFPSAG